MPAKKTTKKATTKKTTPVEKKVTEVAEDIKNEANETIENVKDVAEKATQKAKDIAEDLGHDAKEFAHDAGEKAKEFFQEGKKSVEDLVDRVIDEEKVNSYYAMVVENFKTATFKDWVVFAIGVFFLIRALVNLTEVVGGIILLLVSIVLFNMFFNRK